MIRPLKRILLVEIMREQDPKKGAIFTPREASANFDKVKILEVGPGIKDIKKGEIAYVHKVVEPLEIGGRIGFIAEDRVYAIEEQGVPDKITN